MFDWLFRLHITPLVFNSLGGGHTDTHIHTHTDVRIKVISKNQARAGLCCAWFKNLMHGRNPFIMPKQKTGENDLHELLGNDCGYYEGTICVVNGCISAKRMVFLSMHGRTNCVRRWRAR